MASTSKGAVKKTSNKRDRVKTKDEILANIPETLDEGFYIREWAGLILLFDSMDRANLSKLCSDGGKRLDIWLDNRTSQDFLASYEEEGKDPTDFMSKSLEHPITFYRGKYGHKDLVIEIAGWVYKELQKKMKRILRTHFDEEARQREARLKAEVEGLQTEKFDLQREVREMREEARRAQEEARAAVRRMEEQNEYTHTQLRVAVIQREDMRETLEETHATVVRTEARVRVLTAVAVPPAEDERLLHHFGIMKLNMPRPIKGMIWTYKVFCRQARSANTAKEEIREEYGRKRVETLLELKPNPNAKNFLHRLTDKFGKGGKKAPQQVFKKNNCLIRLLDEFDDEDMRTAVLQIIADSREYGLEIAESEIVEADE